MLKCNRIFGIFLCPKENDRIKAIEKTWLPRKLKNDLVFYVYGTNDNSPARLEGRKLYVPCVESYETLAEKTYEFFKYCSLNIDFNYIIKMDSDIYVDNRCKNLIKSLDTYFKDGYNYCGKFVTGECGNRKHHYNLVPKELRKEYEGKFPLKWAQGHCYMLGKDTVDFIASIDKTKIPELKLDVMYEDAMIGTILENNKNVKIFNFNVNDYVLHFRLSSNKLNGAHIIKHHKKQKETT